MIVGITRLTLAIPGALSLKEKRSVVKRALDRVRARFNIAAAEVDAQDAIQRAVLGFATVGSDATRIRAILEKVVGFVENTGLAQVMAAETETATYGEEIGEDALQSYAEKFGVDESWPPEVDAPAESVSERRRALIRPGSLGFGSQGEPGDALREDLGHDVGGSLRNDLGDDLRNDLGDDLRNDLGDDLRNDLGDDLRNDLGDDLRNDLGDDLRNNLGNDSGDHSGDDWEDEE